MLAVDSHLLNEYDDDDVSSKNSYLSYKTKMSICFGSAQRTYKPVEFISSRPSPRYGWGTDNISFY